jgi:hypothetical protein
MITGNISNMHRDEAATVLAENNHADPRWQLLDRIFLTAPFQKSNRLPVLLRHLAEHSMDGTTDQLTEQRIGSAVFGKSPHYSPAEDSSVRVHVRQLRLRLHEYFACDGRGESLIAEIPKGSYELTFHGTQNPGASKTPAAITVPGRTWRRAWLATAFTWVAAGAAVACGAGWYHAVRASRDAGLQWPVSAVVQHDKPTKVVVSDGRAMLRLVAQRQFSLDDYLKPEFLHSLTPSRMDSDVSRLVKYISDSQITSFADTLVASTLVKLAGADGDNLMVYTARDINRRDLDQGNFVFVGGPTSNPWVLLFANKLNFEVVEDSVGGKMFFRNKKLIPGEQATYEGLPYPGSGGEDYGTISLLPSSSGSGNILILQGLREEGTEGLSILLANENNRAQLWHALKLRTGSRDPIYFEALIRAQTVAGAPVSISIIATRIISP